MTKSKKGLRGEQLSELYPQPKTYDERKADERHLEELRRARRPKKPRLRIATWGSLVFMLITLLIGNVEQLWFTGNLAMIAFTFLGWLATIFLVISWARYVVEVSYAYDESTIRFWVVSNLIMIMMFAAVFYGWFGLDTGLFSVVLLGGLYFVVVYACLRVVLRLRED